MMSVKYTTIFAILFLCILRYICCQDSSLNDFYLKASKNVPRLGRSGGSKGSNDDFENFFLKASKSVPRIGRRDQIQQGKSLEDLPNSYIYTDKVEIGPNMRKHLSEIAKLLEYNTEELASNERVPNSRDNYDDSSNEKEYTRMKRTSSYA